jgi:glycerate 2-kinase
MNPRALLRAMFDAAVAAAMPEHCIAQNLPPTPKGRTIVVGAGKASAAMAAEFERAWGQPVSGLIVTRYGHGAPCKNIEIIEAAHPVPDDASTMAARRMLDLVAGLTADDLVVALMSGGASALLSLPAGGISAEDKRQVNRALLQSGAPIAEMNCVRKHLSAIKGGRLALAAHPARVVSLVISDVPGDDLAAVGSGPTVADPTTFAEARAIIAKYGIEIPVATQRHLEAGVDETPKTLGNVETHLIASPQKSLEAAADIARKERITPLILGDSIEGEAREVGAVMAGIAQQARRFGQPAVAPCVLISGGETTVTVKGRGAGGRNVEFLLALALKLNGAPRITALAADTDGVDGSRDVAGAFAAPDTLARARGLGIDPAMALANNDGHGFFEALGDQITTGPTLTNVNDFRAILIEQEPR